MKRLIMRVNWFSITAVLCLAALALMAFSGDATPLLMTMGIVSAIWAVAPNR